MNTKKRSFVIATLMLLAFCIGIFALDDAGAAQRGKRGTGIVSLTDDEKATMTYIREEEKIARDVYIKMFELWEAPIFSNISVSEQRHMDAILNLLIKYGVPDPAAGKAVGEFTPKFQPLYDWLISWGDDSLLAALLVGQFIEEMDIEDLVQAMDETSKTDLDNVYGNLLNGSYNHLDAFNAHIESLMQ